MKRKYCTFFKKCVHPGICIPCGRLKRTQISVEGQAEDVWDCEHLHEKVTFRGPYTEQDIPRAHRDNSPIGTVKKATYRLHQIEQ